MMANYVPGNDLATRMITLANKGHSRSVELRKIAGELNELTRVWFSPNAPLDTHKRLVGKWAEARRLWRETTGEEI